MALSLTLPRQISNSLIRQLQTQHLTAKEEVQEGQELLIPTLRKWMRSMVQAAEPDGIQAPVDVSLQGRSRPLLPQVPLHLRTSLGWEKRKTLFRIPVPFTPGELMDVTLKPTPARKKATPSTGPGHVKSGITHESLVSLRGRLKKVGPPRTTRQTNPWMASLSCGMDKK